MSASDIELPNDGGPTGADTPAGPDTEPEPDTGGQSLFDRLLSTHTPDKNPPDLQREYEVSKGIALMLYGALQMTETGGMPAVGNMMLGAALEVQARDLGSDDDESDGETNDVDVTELTE